ncbi:MAG TPA: SRPBCC domain-containing protein [Patescibacteria group bacterium]|nr:SRPBCC domain-containing protein [Patescibacteria group bacterium]
MDKENESMAPIKEVTFEKTYDAPIEKVWQAWTDPEMLKQWWGPENVIIPECEVDLRIGGKFYIVMEAGEAMGPYKGTKWPMDAKFTVVEPKSKLAYSSKAWTEGAADEMMIEQDTQLELSEENGKTKLKLKASVNKIGPGAQMATQGMQAGFTQQLDKLTNFLAK